MKRIFKLGLSICVVATLLGMSASTQAQQSSANSKSGLAGMFSQQKDEFLKPDEAFQVSAVATAADKIEVQFVVTKGYYLYRKRLGFVTDLKDVKLGEPQLPKGDIKNDEFFGEMEVYHHPFVAAIPVSRAAGGAIKLKLTVKYQGCAEAGLCYNPLEKEFDIDLPASDTASKADTPSSSSTNSSGGEKVSEQDKLGNIIRHGSLLSIVAWFFVTGLWLSFTGCVLPTIPIISGIIVGQGNQVTPLKGFLLSFSYVQGLALTYAIVGAIFAALFTLAPQGFFQKPWIIISFAGLFVVLAFSMFGAFTLQLPSRWQTALSDVSNRQQGGTFVGTFVMGALSALIVTACVAPASAAALAAIGQARLIGRGALALYVMGFGMGSPLLLVGASAGSLLPKAGAWMDSVKATFGVVFIGLAIFISASITPAIVTMLLWAALAIISGYWLLTLTHGTKQAPAFVRGFGLFVLVYGILLLIGAVSGRTDPLQPLQGLSANASAGGEAHHSGTHAALPFKHIKSVADLDREVAAAATANKPVMLDINAEWCTSCKEMEKYTFPDAQVVAALSNAVLLQADVTANDADDKAILNRFQIFGPPTIAFFVNGQEKTNYRVVGYVKANEFAAHIKEAFAI